MPKKPQYFDPKVFVDKVMHDCEFGKLDESTERALREGIQRRLAERIVASVIESFTEREIALLEKVIEDHPELDDIDAIMLISTEVQNLQERLEKAIMDLYEEMVYDVRQIQVAMDNRRMADAASA